MSSLGELHTAQVRTRARQFAHVYNKLQHLINSRTKAGHINGAYVEDVVDDQTAWRSLDIKVDTDVIKVTIKCYCRPPQYDKKLVIHFATKR